MEPQTLFNLIFAITTLLLFVVLVCVKTGGGASTQPTPPTVKDRESLMSDDNYQGNPDEVNHQTSPMIEEVVSQPRHSEDLMMEADAAAAAEETYCDILVHHNAANLPIPQFVNLANGYHADLVSGSNVVIDRLKRTETFCAVKPIPNAYSSFKDPYVDNAHFQWSSRMAELWFHNEYMSANKAKFRAMSDAVCYTSADPYNSRMYVVRLLRVVDKHEFYYVHFTQTFKNSYTDDLSYTALVQALNTLKRFHSDGEYVIVGNFNVHGHEAVFRHHLPDHYAVCDFRSVPTSMDIRGRGVASPDGLVVSTRVYEAIEYHTVMSDLNATNGALVVLAALYIKHPHNYKGPFVSEHWPLQYMMDDLSATLAIEKDVIVDSSIPKQRLVYYGKPSSFDPSIHTTDTLMYATDLRATCVIADVKEILTTSAVEAISSNILYRTRPVAEPPATTFSKSVGNNVVMLQPNTPPMITTTLDTTPIVNTVATTSTVAEPLPAKTSLTTKIHNRFTRSSKKDRSTPPPTIAETPEPSAPPIELMPPPLPATTPYTELFKDLEELKKRKH